MQNIKVELLAPAGNAEAFYGAIYAGADAVYLGGSKFGARAYADNFTEEELIACIRYAHIFNRKVYLTVNTLVKEREMGELYGYLKPFYEAGLDGVIVQDTGVFCYIRDHFPGLPLHVSTQMTITGSHGAAMLKEMGACRVVPARELSLKEIQKIKEDTGLEMETFIHGAMCYCYSGQCLFSSILGGRSGNRGRCAQPCRLPYSVTGQGNHCEMYPLSLKDMCTIEMLPELIEAGIDSFKIEGRMKKPEYAAGVTSIYRKYIDMYLAKREKTAFKVAKEDLEKLSKLYIRSERQNGYYHKHNGKDMITLTNPAYSGSDDSLLGEIRAQYLNKKRKHPIAVYGTFRIGEPASVSFLAGDISVTVTGEEVQAASKQPITQENIEKQLRKLGDSVFEAEDITVELEDGAFYSLKALNDLRREAVSMLEDMIIEANGFPARRTEAVEECAEGYSEGYSEGYTKFAEKRKDCTETFGTEAVWKKSQDGFHVSVHTLDQLRAISEWQDRDRITRLYIDGDLLDRQKADGTWDLPVELKHLKTAEVIVSLPRILRAKEDAYLQRLYELVQEKADCFDGFSVSSTEAMGFLLEKEYTGKIYAEPGFYLWNQVSLAQWAPYLQGFCMPYELNGSEQKDLLLTAMDCEKIFYGRIPMMVTANCVRKTTAQCSKAVKGQKQTGRCIGAIQEQGLDILLLTDRYRKQFPVETNCEHCYNVIYNSVPLSLHNEWRKWKGTVALRLDLTVENARETLTVLDFFGKIYDGGPVPKDGKTPFGEYTTGHEKRGVE